MNLKGIENRARALEEKAPTPTRTPKFCVVTSHDPADIRAARIVEAERVGDPIIEVEFYACPTEPGEVAL